MVVAASGYQWDWHFVWQSLPFLGGGILVTLRVCGLAALLMFAIAFVAAAARMSRFWILRALVTLYLDFFRSTPFLVQLVWFFFALPLLTGQTIGSFTAATIGLALYIGAYETEVVRAGILSVESGQREAALALGLPRWKAMLLVVLPQALVRMIPPTMTVLTFLIKESAIVSAVTVADLMWRANSVAIRSYHPVEPLTFAGLAYAVLIVPLTVLARLLHRRNRVWFE